MWFTQILIFSSSQQAPKVLCFHMNLYSDPPNFPFIVFSSATMGDLNIENVEQTWQCCYCFSNLKFIVSRMIQTFLYKVRNLLNYSRDKKLDYSVQMKL